MTHRNTSEVGCARTAQIRALPQNGVSSKPEPGQSGKQVGQDQCECRRSWDNGKASWGREMAIRKSSTLLRGNNGVRREPIIKSGDILG